MLVVAGRIERHRMNGEQTVATKSRGRAAKVRQPSEKKFQEEKQRVATDEGMPTPEEGKKRQRAAEREQGKGTR